MRPDGRKRRITEGWQFSLIGRFDKIVRVAPGDCGPGAACVFDTDEQALDFVQTQAKAGSEYHAECLKYAVVQKLKGRR